MSHKETNRFLSAGISGLKKRAFSFRQEQRGSMLIFGFFILIAMLAASGMAVDIVRHEMRRVQIQTTLDRAVLAAADLNQTRDPKVVVQDYLDAAGMSGVKAVIPEPETGLGFKSVTATGSTEVRPYFMRLLGIDQISVATTSAAEERIENIEVSLVLDISGSMRFTDSTGDPRITSLRAAAKEFVDIVLGGDAKLTSTINLVPYAGQVNPGPYLFDKIGGKRDHGYSSCPKMERADFDYTGLPTFSTKQVPHFMKWDIANSWMDWGWCPSDNAAIQVASNNAAELKKFIEDVRLHDGTGTHIGMRWGLALLDPATKPVIADMKGQDFKYNKVEFVDGTGNVEDEGDLYASTEVTVKRNKVEPGFRDQRPAAWDADDTIKYIVLMTDGNITDQFVPKKTGFDGSSKDKDRKEPDKSRDQDGYKGTFHDFENWKEELDDQPYNWGDKTMTSSRADNVTDFYKACTLAKNNGVIIFTVAFEVATTASAHTEMETCATGGEKPGLTSYYHNVKGATALKGAFAEIARTIHDLRLTR
ncbi:Tad domain-containing protein [Litoreibacter roseus]|uniref:Putative Flp pilus-assembly TadG-like N-terminal domain-containing protein n=1 Tax=Litoreibacter roseus TaxID=2601869 RepID=A0A6N6JE56_9RHOB|nr:Tad domain-containing protein [Litoreibacter roseus]GFE63492.1 hypothetical protein KIN_05660 [Litoreibacter roseus]